MAYFDPNKPRTLAGIELSIGSTNGTVDGIVWKWSDGSVNTSPKTLKTSKTTELKVDKGTTFIGFSSWTDMSYGLYGLSLLEVDPTCVAKQTVSTVTTPTTTTTPVSGNSTIIITTVPTTNPTTTTTGTLAKW